MKLEKSVLAWLLAAGACAQPADEPRGAAEQAPAAVAQAPAPLAPAEQVAVAADKPLIHVWKSPT